MGISYTWTGATDTDLDVATNYSPNGIPTTGDDVFFPDAPVNRVESGSLICDQAVFNTLAEIWGGDFTGTPVIISYGQVHGGSFPTGFANYNCVFFGYFRGTFENHGFVYDGNFSLLTVMNNAYNIYGGTYPSGCTVVNSNTLTDGIFNGLVNSSVNIVGGQYNYYVDCSGGNVSGGTFNCDVLVEVGAALSAGTFNGNVRNFGTIAGGTYKSIENVVDIYDGIFTDYVYNHGSGYCVGDFSLIKRIKLFDSKTFNLIKAINSPIIMAI